MTLTTNTRTGTLHALAGLLILSALVRVGISGEAYAEAAQSTESSPVIEVEGDSPTDRLFHALKQREDRLKTREQQLDDRLRALALAEREATERLDQLVEAESSLRTMLEQVEIAAETDVDHLVAVYETMKPKEAADLFAQMPPGFAAGFLAMLTPQTAGQILALLPSENAYSISVVLAGRNADLPDQ